MTTAIDIPTGLDEFFKAEGSSEAQRADAIAVLTKQCAMIGDVVTLTATGETLDSEKSKAWIAANKPHLLPPIYERSLADRAFVDGNGMARNALVKQIGKAEADKLAQKYGLKSAHDTKHGTAPTRADDDAGKKKTAATIATIHFISRIGIFPHRGNCCAQLARQSARPSRRPLAAASATHDQIQIFNGRGQWHGTQ